MTPEHEDLATFARSKGWTAEPTPRGRLRLTKSGSVVFVPGPNASRAAIAEAVSRIGWIDGFMARRRRP
jgi:hypothetical protein